MDTPAIPIRRQLIRIILLTSAAVLVLTASAFLAYELLTFRQSTQQQVRTLSEAIAVNSSAALAFDNADDAQAILAAFEADPHIVAAALYDQSGQLFATYPASAGADVLPAELAEEGYRFVDAHLIGFQPVFQNERQLGTLFVRSDLTALNQRILLYGGVVALVIAASILLAYGLSRRLQHQISRPILDLAVTATTVAETHDYAIRARSTGTAEVNQLTDAFNQLLGRIQQSEGRLQIQLGHLNLLQHITRAISDRQDLASISQVVLQTLEGNLPVDLSLTCSYDVSARVLVVATVGPGSRQGCERMALMAGATIPTAENHLNECIAGELIHEPDTRAGGVPLLKSLSASGYGSVVVSPLMAEGRCVGALLVARKQTEAFTSPECEFLRQLSEHVGLASQQAQLHRALLEAYDELRQTQQTVLQQERLRALGQMASGIAHDINNAISPVALYTESLLEREPNLSDRARGYLTTIQRAIEDVASTVARMKEFYRQRESQLTLSLVDINKTVQQAVELTKARWSDLPQQRGIFIELKTDYCGTVPKIMAAEGEIRDALNNLIFNAVDAMPEGGILTLRTRLAANENQEGIVLVEVVDSGLGMDEETRKRCLEPFFTTKGERGTGLGLAMVYGMTQRHSAELQIDSEKGQGTTFRLIFAQANPGIVSRAPVEGAPAVVDGLRILVVDDDPLLIKSLEDILTTDGHEVVVAPGGQNGIDRFVESVRAKNPFPVVITDLGMPQVDGRKVAAAVKAAAPRTRTIMLTGWGQRLLSDNDVPPGVDRVLSKPPRLHELRQALRDVSFSGEPAVYARAR